jgi:DNA-binding SARP family transcriptional activator
MRTFVPTILASLGLLALGAGRWQEAVDLYAKVADEFTGQPWVSGVMHWRGDRIEALLRAGHRQHAMTLMADLQVVAASEGPWERAAAARCAALLADDDALADASFAEAIALHTHSPSVFERARTELCWAERLLERDPAQAARLLARSGDDFDRLRGGQWAARASALLERANRIAAASPSGADGSRVVVRALGPLVIISGGTPTRVGTDVAGRALRYVVAAGGSVSAGELIEALWPDSDGRPGPARLRTVLSRVRSRYGPVLVRHGSVIRWADSVDVDAHQFADLARRVLADPDHPDAVAGATEAVRMYVSDLLPMYRYADWAVSSRERLRRRYLDLLDLLATRSRRAGDLDKAAGYLRAAVEAEPLDESRYVPLIQVLLEGGRTGQARAALERARSVIVDLGVPSSTELRELQRVLAGEARDIPRASTESRTNPADVIRS